NTYEMLRINSNTVQMTVWPFTSFSHSGLDLKYNCPSVPPPPGNKKPEGFLDSADCSSFNGWSRDPDTTSAISVHFYADGPAGTGTFIGSVKANSFRSDLCNLWGNGNADCFHGFSFSTPGSLKNGMNHAIYVHGIDSSGGENPLLGSVPRTINCPSVPLNMPPVLDPVGNKVINEGQLLQFTISGSDPNNDVLAFSAANLPSGASFNPASRIFSWTPNFQQAGIYQVTFTVSDSFLSDSETITITVLNVNQPPDLVNPGNKQINEGQLLQFQLQASDPDNDVLAFSSSGLPSGATLSSSGLFSWVPDFNQSGSYIVTFVVSDGSLSDSETIVINVHNVNRPPVLDNIGSKVVFEGDILQFTINGSDPDGDNVAFSASNLPSGSSFNAATRTFSWTPGFGQSGVYNVTFSVSDGFLSDSETIAITVVNINRPPVLDPVGNKVISEGQLLQFTISGSDPDGDAIAFFALNLPSGASFNPANRTFSWTPGFSQSGLYNVTFSVTDGLLSDAETITIAVTDTNRAPSLVSGNVSPSSGTIFTTFTYRATYSDPDNDAPAFVGLFVDGGFFDDMAQENPSDTNYTDGAVFFISVLGDELGKGVHSFFFDASDGMDVVISENFTGPSVINLGPALEPVSSKFVNEGELVEFLVKASDPDDSVLTLSMAAPPPVNASFVLINGTTAGFSWSPGFDAAGSYVVGFMASDGSESAAINVTITVGNVNRAPKIVTTPLTELVEPDLESFSAVYRYDSHAVDPDGDNITYSLTVKPEGATIDPATGAITWKPNKNQLGPNFFTLVASDGLLSDTQSWTVIVKLPPRIGIPRRELFVEHVIIPECMEPGSEDVLFVSIENIGQDAQLGKYDLRVTMSNDFVRRVKHREFEVREECPCEACLGNAG
ncbi:tandem-95 repeat protein, partial [Candidatus Woesearchaeota archaeon]|nr:tandem-95 repeat protein [Candidatus Woesearchaeota archaeon]